MQKEFESESRTIKTRSASRKQLTLAQIQMLSNGEDIEDAIERASDPHAVESSLTDFQIGVSCQ